LMWLERRGARTEGRAVGLFQSAESRGEAAHRQSDRDLDIKADEALEAARALPAGKAKVEAMKRAGLLRKAADDREIRFAKRGRPPKKFPR
jgi:hypothetical protein